uniref:Ral guanine nucleotide dissociation stimulator-like 3a n=1 Tax=Periophthalmus magnuspinnatus TaxID=409849 RepID=A0A3B4BEV5_9GOBI
QTPPHNRKLHHEWGEEVEDGAVYGVTLRREPVPSSAPCTAFVQYRTCKVRRLKAATLNQLVNHLLDPKNQDQDYGQILLSTYRTFTCTSTLIERLFLRYSEKCLYFSHLFKDRLFAWLDDYSEDFRDPPCHAALRLLLDHLTISSAVHSHMRMQPNFCSLAGQAADLLKSFQKEDAESNLSTTQELSQAEYCPADDDSGCENSLDLADVMDFATVAIAEQLTRLDAALFVKVVPYECLGSVWSQRDKENLSPTIRATVAQFNAVTNQVILSLSTPAQRARIIEKWIRVAQVCTYQFLLLFLNNQSSLSLNDLPILSALQSNAVYRLRNLTGAHVTPTSIILLTWHVSCFFQSTSSGVVPYLGTYLTVLTMWDTALSFHVYLHFILFCLLQTFSSSCSRESVFSTEVSSHSPSPSSSSSSDTHLDSLCSPPASECGGARPKDGMGSHKRSVSMTSLPVYNRQVADSCIIRISVDSGHNNGNMYKSILLTSQDKTAQVVQRALEKHNLEHMNFADFTLTQVISSERELLIPDKANVFYAMSTTANFDFVLRKYEQDQKKPLSSTQSLGRYTK